MHWSENWMIAKAVASSILTPLQAAGSREKARFESIFALYTLTLKGQGMENSSLLFI
jgi:hypothetical protein